MGMSDQPPVLSKEQRLEEALLVEMKRSAELEFQVADLRAALVSKDLTRERERLAEVFNTDVWVWDFDNREYRRRPGR